MASLYEIQNAGLKLTDKPDTAGMVFNAIKGFQDRNLELKEEQRKKEERSQKKQKDTLDYFISLREAGYDEDSAGDLASKFSKGENYTLPKTGKAAGEFQSEKALKKRKSELDVKDKELDIQKKEKELKEGKELTPFQQQEARIKKGNALAIIQSKLGSDKISGRTMNLQSKDDMFAYLINNFKDVDINDPDIQQALVSAYPEIAQEAVSERITIPERIKKIYEAVTGKKTAESTADKWWR